MSDITLYHNPLSGHAHRPWALLKLLNLPFKEVHVDFFKGEHKTAEFLALNPLGQVPVLVDGTIVVRDSTAALVYLALKYDPSRQWLPEEPVLAAEVQQWLAISTKEVFDGPGTARMIKIFNAPRDHAEAVAKTDALLSQLFENHLAARDWLVGEQPTIADIANYGYIAAVTEGEVDLALYPNTQAWVRCMENYHGFAPMPPAAAFLPS